MKKIAFSGTLDPITNGHMWVIGEARALADEVTVFLSENPLKKPQFDAEKRKQIIELSARERGWTNVQVVIIKGDYTARAAKRHGIDYLIRGIRNNADFDYENLLQQTNVDVLNGAKTIFVMPPRDLGSVSSSFVRALQGPVGWHWSMKKFVPGPAYAAWILDWLHSEWKALWQYQNADPKALADAERWFEFLTGPSCYGSEERHYHNLDHLVHGLSEIRVWAVNVGAAQPDVDTLMKAFWFHDAVYQQRRNDVSDEEESARLWLSSGLDSTVADEVAQLIRATDHFQESAIAHPLKNILLGADLAILGQEAEVYDTYRHAIRAEYAHVPEQEYSGHRCKALMHLHRKAQAGALYADAFFATEYNQQAMTNMRREIAELGGAAFDLG
jgi:pantetheine-phosphate adenylyltransferase